jgi:polar amino acid transport system substrate-binding protein
MIRPKLLAVAVVAAGAVLLAGCGDSKDDSSSASSTTAKSGSSSSSGSLVVCSDIPYEPMEFEATKTTTPSGYTGFDIDLAQEIATKANKKLEVKVTPFDGIFAAMDAGNCDAVISAVSIKPDRKKNMDFTQPYYDSGQSLMVLKTNQDKYKTLDDLKGKNIGVQSGTTGEDYAKANTPSGATITSLPGAADLFAALQSGSIDAVLQDYPVNQFRAAQDDLFVVSKQFPTKEQYGMAVKKGDAATLKLLDDGITEAKANGTYATLYKKYFGEAPPNS